MAICLVPLCGVMAFAVDLGLALEWRRRLQGITDAAALAAASDLYANFATNGGLDPKGTAAATATLTSNANGFPGQTSFTVNIPPKSGPFTGYAGYAEVLVQYNLPRGFSSIFSSAPIAISSRSVARGLLAPFQNGILLLDPTGSSSLADSGNGTITVTGGSIVVNSSSSTAANLSGNATVKAPSILVCGGTTDISCGNSRFIGALTCGADPVADPLKYISEPDPASLPTGSSGCYSLYGNNTATLNPGVYNGGINLSGNSSATLNPGIYYIQNGTLSVSGNANLTAKGVCFFNKGGGDINISGNGKVEISPPTSGSCKGISIFQSRSCTNTASVSGNGNMNVTGTLYVPNAMLNVSGNGSNNVIGSQYIAYDLQVSGNGSVNVVWTGGTTANTRVVGLVE